MRVRAGRCPARRCGGSSRRREVVAGGFAGSNPALSRPMPHGDWKSRHRECDAGRRILVGGSTFRCLTPRVGASIDHRSVNARRTSREAHLPATQQEPPTYSWFSQAFTDAGGQGSAASAAGQGAQASRGHHCQEVIPAGAMAFPAPAVCASAESTLLFRAAVARYTGSISSRWSRRRPDRRQGAPASRSPRRSATQ